MNDTLLEVSGVSKSFDGFKAINNLSIQIANGRDYEAVEAQRRVNGDHRGFTMWSAIMLSAHRMWSGKIDGI